MKNVKIFGLIVIIAVMVGVYIIGVINKKNPMPTVSNSFKNSSLKITSSAFSDNSLISSKYTCDGENVSPPLSFSGVPQSAKSLALIVDDPDAPGGTWIHWVIWNINPDLKEVPENAAGDIGVEGVSSFGKIGYGGPCPPSGTHRYFFKLYALDAELDLPAETTAPGLSKAMENHIIGYAELVGLYSRKR
jgi:hypothetical protein